MRAALVQLTVSDDPAANLPVTTPPAPVIDCTDQPSGVSYTSATPWSATAPYDVVCWATASGSGAATPTRLTFVADDYTSVSGSSGPPLTKLINMAGWPSGLHTLTATSTTQSGGSSMTTVTFGWGLLTMTFRRNAATV